MNRSPGLLDTLKERKYVRGVARADPDRAVILIGSWARRMRISPSSDVDLLVLDTTAPERPPPNVQVLTISPSDFERRAKRGDELAQWALRFGVPLSGGRAWRRLRRELLSDSPWPAPDAHIERAAKRLRGAQELWDMGDDAAASQEMLFALSHAARAELLGRGIFPLSRPELPGQLAADGEDELARDLQQTIDGRLTDDALEGALAMLRRRLSESTPPTVLASGV